MRDLKKLSHRLKDPQVDWMIKELGFHDSPGKQIKCVVVPYVKISTVMEILDSRAGAGDWQFQLVPISLGNQQGFKAGLAVWDDAKSEWIWRAGVVSGNSIIDGDDDFDITKSGGQKFDKLKMAESAALKRAAQKFGIFRYASNTKPFLIDWREIFAVKDKSIPKKGKIIRLTKRSTVQPNIDHWCHAPKHSEWMKEG